MTNISIIQNRLAILIQRLKDSQIFKINSKNKFQNDRDSNFKRRSKSMRQYDRRRNTISNRSNQINNSINKN